jgi:glycosyltransferase involved in cell wall biosynthesis
VSERLSIVDNTGLRKIFHIITSLDVGGAEAMLQKLVLGIDRSRFECEVVALTALGSAGREIAASGVSVRDLRMSPGRLDPRAFGRLARWIHRTRPDVVHTWMYHADLVGGLAARAVCGAPVVWGIRGSFDPVKSKRHMIWTARTCAALSTVIPRAIVSCSTALAETHADLGYDARRMRVIPNGFDTSVYLPDITARASVREELRIAPETPLVGHLARWDPQKDHVGFVEAALRVAQLHPGAHFVMCGAGIDDRNAAIVAPIRRSGAGERFHLLGRREDAQRVTAALDVLVSSSIYGEGFPNVLGEAMACAVPCVATDVGDSAMVVGDTGRVTPAHDPVALSSAIVALLELGPKGRSELGRAARRRVEERFALHRVVAGFESLYEEVTDDVRHRRLR